MHQDMRGGFIVGCDECHLGLLPQAVPFVALQLSCQVRDKLQRWRPLLPVTVTVTAAVTAAVTAVTAVLPVTGCHEARAWVPSEHGFLLQGPRSVVVHGSCI